MEHNDTTLTLIVPGEAGGGEASFPDRAGGKAHSGGLVGRIAGGAQKRVDLGQARGALERSLKEVQGLLASVDAAQLGGWAVDGFTVGLAVTGEGSVGVATLGVEASIEVSFARMEPSGT